ncbi:hypothetical protein Bbelb_406980 [Branchiostoma belcheri]|nr:hypothetical protein Bbelb_406980 [Branchiostoma belcheri]
MVQNSSKALMWEGLCHLARRDCVREGDGPASIDSIIKYFSGIGGFLPARLRHDLTWNRTGNIKGGPGKNVGLDLINEFWNNEFKDDKSPFHKEFGVRSLETRDPRHTEGVEKKDRRVCSKKKDHGKAGRKIAVCQKHQDSRVEFQEMKTCIAANFMDMGYLGLYEVMLTKEPYCLDFQEYTPSILKLTGQERKPSFEGCTGVTGNTLSPIYRNSCGGSGTAKPNPGFVFMSISPIYVHKGYSGRSLICGGALYRHHLDTRKSHLQELIPGLSKRRIDQARAHSAEAGPGKPPGDRYRQSLYGSLRQPLFWSVQTMEERVRRVFRDVWGFEPREPQLRATLAALAGTDVFVGIATGQGKSLCYQSIPLCVVEPKLVIVVSPLAEILLNWHKATDGRRLDQPGHVGFSA